MSGPITTGSFPGPMIGGTFTETDLPGGGKLLRWIGDGYKELSTMMNNEVMTAQLTRDQLLQQRLWAATNDCAAAMKELAAFTDNPPHAADSQEEHVRYIESALQSLRYNCRKLREYKP